MSHRNAPMTVVIAPREGGKENIARQIQNTARQVSETVRNRTQVDVNFFLEIPIL
jgi:undecaprenyl pyrophosphate synthase